MTRHVRTQTQNCTHLPVKIPRSRPCQSRTRTSGKHGLYTQNHPPTNRHRRGRARTLITCRAHVVRRTKRRRDGGSGGEMKCSRGTSYISADETAGLGYALHTPHYLNAGPRWRFHGHPVRVQIRHGLAVQLFQVLLQGLVLCRGHEQIVKNVHCHGEVH